MTEGKRGCLITFINLICNFVHPKILHSIIEPGIKKQMHIFGLCFDSVSKFKFEREHLAGITVH